MGTTDAVAAYDAVRGLSPEQVRQQREQYGANVLPAVAGARPLRQLLRQLTHLLAILLWVAAGLALLGGMPVLAVAITVIVLLNAVFAFAQEHRADRSAERLRDLLPVRARVVRAGREESVEVTELVVGDLVHLEAGDRVGADLVVRVAHTLELDESMLTGESTAVPHEAGDALLSGTFVLQGQARATVVAVGADTTIAGITRLSQSAHRPPSPLTVQLGKVVRVIAVVAFSVGGSLGVGSLLLGLSPTEAFLFGVGVSVALVPEGLLPTVTLSLARGAQLMAERQALVRRLDAVETLGATTYICTDKTGTLTQNRMSVVAVVTPDLRADVAGEGYEPVGVVSGAAPEALRALADAAVRCATGRVVEHDGRWVAIGDPMEAAVHCLALRLGVAPGDVDERRPYTAARMLSSTLHAGEAAVLGAPEEVLARCAGSQEGLRRALDELTARGLRVLAVARRSWDGPASDEMEHDLEALGLLALQDPPRVGVGDALRACHTAGIRVAMVTGDHPRTAQAIAVQVGLIEEGGLVVDGRDLPADDAALAALLDRPDGVVVARVTPEDKLRIAAGLRSRGHVVAMTGDGVNDAPALREADVGVAMGEGGSDVAREAADLVLLDDQFATIVTAIELGRATFQNVRRFLTYHLTDNVAELAPFAVWAASGGSFPLAIGVLQVLALDIGTDMLPALALGAEPGRPDTMRRQHRRTLIDRALAVRAFLVLGLTEAVCSLGAFAVVLHGAGWRWGEEPDATTLAIASGTAFATISVMQVANAFACRSTRLPVWRLDLTGNRLLLAAVAVEVVILLALVGIPPVADLLGGSLPSAAGWAMVLAGGVVLLLVDAGAKWVSRRQGAGGQGRPRPRHASPARRRRARRAQAPQGAP